ncbi:MAG TPA: hypothetical protein VHB47_25290 [Thermoanaerobaculia bacterium]|nr:hypothetical protein [Thermoanaerobaculia bacterium]
MNAVKTLRCLQAVILAFALTGAPTAAADPPVRPGTGDRQTDPASTSTLQDPVVVFTSPGLKPVTLTVCNRLGCSTITKQVLVLQPPAPTLIAMTVAPARAEVGQEVLLEASANGRTPLTYSWQVLQGGFPLVQAQGPTAVWATAGFNPGAYTVLLTIANADGTATAQREALLLPPAPTRYFTVTPCRALDTRNVGGPLLAGAPPRLAPIAGVCGVPTSARAVALNVTAVAPTVSGYLSVYPADYPHPLTSSVNFARGTTRAACTVMPLATDGSGQLAVSAALAAGAGSRVDLLLDVSGYFAPTSGGAPQPLELQPRPCLLGFCEFATGTPVWFSQAFTGTIAQYRYDWTGTGVFTEESAQPVLSHSYAEPGFYLPVVEVSSSTGTSATLAASSPIYVVPADPTSVPPPPASVSATFAGFVNFSSLDPTLGGSGQRLPSFALSVTGAPKNITGYDIYLSKSGGPYTLAAALPPDLTSTAPLALAPVALGETVRLQLAPLNYAGAGPRSTPITLQAP